jgi:hypothetical protein
MPDANVLPDATTTDGALLVLAIVLPAAGVLLSFVLGGRYAERIASVLLPSGLFLATIIFADVWHSGWSTSSGIGNLRSGSRCAPTDFRQR